MHPTFQRAMNCIFGDIKNVIIYLDDILIVAQTEEEMISLIESVLKRLQQYNMKIRIDK